MLHILLRVVVAVYLLLLLGIEKAGAGILVFAPHPDDDIITAAGVIRNAVSRGQSVKVVYLTNGDAWGTSTGLLRQNEAVTAQTSYLGTSEDDLIFLGYPDAHIQDVYTGYPNSTDQAPFGNLVTYGTRGLGHSDYHAFRFGSPAYYNRANMVLDLQDIIATYKPEHIYTLSQHDTHTDHTTAYALLKLALTAVSVTDPTYTPVIHKTVVHFAPNWPALGDPTAYNTDGYNDFGGGPLQWSARESLDVPFAMQSADLALNPKVQAIAAHVSQGGYSGLLSTFAHKDEVFWSENLHDSNQPPRAAAGFDALVTQGVTAQLNGSASVDPDSQTLTYQWTQTAGPTVVLENATTAMPTFVAPSVSQSTVLSFQLVVNDGTLNSAPDLVNVTVNDVPAGNQPPTANAGPNQTVIQGTLVQLSGSGTDPESGPLTYQWTQTAGPAVVLGNATTATPSFVAPNVSQSTLLTFRLTVTDNQNATATDTVTITVNPASGGGTVLQNNVPATGLTGAAGADLHFTFAVPAGMSNLRFVLSGGTGDADLYVRFASTPTLQSYDCRPYVAGNNETCAMPAATAGTWYVMIRGYAAFSGVTLTASYSGGN